MWEFNYRLFFYFVLFLGIGCKKDSQVDAPSPDEVPTIVVSPIKLSLSKDTLVVSQSGNVSIDVSIQNLAQVRELIILKKVNLLESWKKVAVSEIDKNYKFTYTVTPQDGDLLDFTFSVVGIDDKLHDTKTLHIEDGKGLVSENLRRVSRATGKSLQGEAFPNPNRTDDRYDVGCTDLGIMWEMGNGNVGIFFGDTDGKTFVPTPGGGGNGQHWRSNVLAFSDDQDLSDGITFSGMLTQPGNTSVAREVIPSAHITNGMGSFTTIPTAAIHANGADYVHYMDIRQWGTAGRWETNFSELYTSTDNGQNWRRSSEIRFAPKSNFAQVTYSKKDGYIYMMGTTPGRFGSTYLSRFLEKDILKQQEYEYWNAALGWVKGSEKSATLMFHGPAGELSLAYNSKFKKWIVTYLNERKAEIVFRYANHANGPWSSERTLVKGSDYPALYGAYIHPLKNDGDQLYFMMSLWHPYNVFLMESKLRLAN